MLDVASGIGAVKKEDQRHTVALVLFAQVESLSTETRSITWIDLIGGHYKAETSTLRNWSCEDYY